EDPRMAGPPGIAQADGGNGFGHGDKFTRRRKPSRAFAAQPLPAAGSTSPLPRLRGIAPFTGGGLGWGQPPRSPPPPKPLHPHIPPPPSPNAPAHTRGPARPPRPARRGQAPPRQRRQGQPALRPAAGDRVRPA